MGGGEEKGEERCTCEDAIQTVHHLPLIVGPCYFKGFGGEEFLDA